jgi:hypothetical protein
MGALNDLLKQFGEQPVPGGCDLCDAYQTIEEVIPGVHSLTVHHDDWCPFLRSRDAETN